MEDVAGPERDEQRRDVLDQECDPDREPVDREEVEPLDEGEAADAPDGEKGQLVTPDAQTVGGGEQQHEDEAEQRPRHPHLREAERRDARGEDDLRDGAVDRPEGRSARGHGVADAGPAPAGRSDGEGGFGHPLYTEGNGT